MNKLAAALIVARTFPEYYLAGEGVGREKLSQAGLPEAQPVPPQEGDVPGVSPDAGSPMAASLNAQITIEQGNWLFYLTLASWLDDQGFSGMSKWMMSQADGELEHANKIRQYLLDRNEKVEMGSIPAPDVSGLNSPLDMFTAAHDHEVDNTGRLVDLQKQALEVGDQVTATFLNWFLEEQIEEEKVTLELVQRISRVGDDGVGLNQIDSELDTPAAGGA